jgi:hypothetical protein
MKRQFQTMFLVNALLGFVFIACNLVYIYAHKSVWWSPLWLTHYTPGIFDLGTKLPNFSFYLFWTLLGTNLYFLYTLQKKFTASGIKGNFKALFSINPFSGFLFIICNLLFAGKNVSWTPLWLTVIDPNLTNLSSTIPNFNFYFFWILLAVNVYFLIRLQRKQ